MLSSYITIFSRARKSFGCVSLCTYRCEGFQNPEKTLFSHIVIDSNSAPERLFVQACEDNNDVLFYIKLPRWFQIETLVGAYNPNWALAYRNDKTLYFVAETKKTGNSDQVQLDLLRPIEDLKFECGKRHFKNFEEVRFRVVSSLVDLVGLLANPTCTYDLKDT